MNAKLNSFSEWTANAINERQELLSNLAREVEIRI